LQLSRVRRLSESAFGFVLLASKIFWFLRESPSLGVTCLYSLSFYTTSSDERESSERKNNSNDTTDWRQEIWVLGVAKKSSFLLRMWWRWW
jgi:hypothetical protein